MRDHLGRDHSADNVLPHGSVDAFSRVGDRCTSGTTVISEVHFYDPCDKAHFPVCKTSDDRLRLTTVRSITLRNSERSVWAVLKRADGIFGRDA